MKTSERPALKEPVRAFAARLAEGPGTVPLTDLAALFGAGEELLERVGTRGDLVFRASSFGNDGPELVLPAGRVELEIPNLLHGTWTAADGGFTLRFPDRDLSLRACLTVAIVRKCFALREMRATPDDLVLDFGNVLADRRYTFA